MSMIQHFNPPAGALVRIISDLHYGHERCQAPEPKELIAAMAGVDILVVAGDLAETRSNAWMQCAENKRSEIRQLCAEQGIQLIEIAGNHDPDVPCMMLSLWEGSSIIIHGHCLFDEVAPWGWEYLNDKEATRAFIAQYPERESNIEQCFNLARDMSLRVKPIFKAKKQLPIDCLNKILHCVWPPERPINIIRAWIEAPFRASRFADRFAPQCKNIIFGHVHRCGKWQKKGRTLITTGAWFKQAYPALVDMKDGEIISYRRFTLPRKEN